MIIRSITLGVRKNLWQPAPLSSDLLYHGELRKQAGPSKSDFHEWKLARLRETRLAGRNHLGPRVLPTAENIGLEFRRREIASTTH